MSLDTRERLVAAASKLFAEAGYAGASVRDICNLARANPGAVSYHFGGKRQLYRTVLRQAAERLARVPEASSAPESDSPTELATVLRSVYRRLEKNRDATRLLLRDLIDGGNLAVEALEPTLRSAVTALRERVGEDDTPRTSPDLGRFVLELAAPVVLLVAGWPALARPLALHDGDREPMLDAMIARVVETSGYD
jgi:AcrR family transcriptional regulator